MPRGEKAPSGVIVWFQENGWMNVNLMNCYVDYFQRIRRSNNQFRFPSMMVYDSFRGIWMNQSKRNLKKIMLI